MNKDDVIDTLSLEKRKLYQGTDFFHKDCIKEKIQENCEIFSTMKNFIHQKKKEREKKGGLGPNKWVIHLIKPIERINYEFS